MVQRAPWAAAAEAPGALVGVLARVVEGLEQEQVTARGQVEPEGAHGRREEEAVAAREAESILAAARVPLDGEITIDGGDQWRPFVHVSDAARAVADIIEAPLELVAGEIFNVGSNEQNYTIRQIGELVHERVMDARLVIRDNASDPRNYRVDFSKLKAILSFSPEWTVTQGIDQVLEAISCGDIVDYRDARYSNVKFLTQTGTNQLDRDRWARDLIDALTGPRADSRP